MAHEHETRPPAAPTRVKGPVAARPAMAAAGLQRAIGNRATGRLLSRWARHPDPDQKKVMVPDSVAEAFVRDNPPQNA